MIVLESCPLACSRIEAFTMMRGSHSIDDHYSGNTVCDYTGDAPAHVALNRQALARTLGIEVSDIITPRQTHSARVAIIPSAGSIPTLNNTDAIVTSRKGILLGINTADCVPILFHDPIAEVIAAAHAGWRGTVALIAKHTVDAMVSLGASPCHIKAFLGASICQQCFEVGDEVVEQFIAANLANSDIIHRNATTGKAHINLHAANRHILTHCGIAAQHIFTSPHCSKEALSLFSARRQGIASGRTLTAIMLKKQV